MSIADPVAAFRQVRLEQLTRVFGDVPALNGFDLTIQRGEFVALLGPSGCGKSTALNCLAGLLPLSGGAIWMDDRRIDGLLPERRGFGMVFQNYALFPHLSVWRNVSFGLEMRRTPSREVHARVERALELVHLTGHARKYPAQLSGGQQQRVAIARAIVIEPVLVLMDEPLSNLDAKLRLEMRSEIKRLHRELGFTTVYVTHDQEEALSLADRVVVLRDGVAQQIGSPEAVYAQPVNLYVASFMGYRNTYELNVERVDGRRVRLSEPGLRLLATVGGDGGMELGTRAVAAIRPEDLVLGEAGGANRITASVDVVEYQGRENAVGALTASDRRIVFRTSARVAVGERVVLSAPPERVLAFPTDAAALAAAGTSA